MIEAIILSSVRVLILHWYHNTQFKEPNALEGFAKTACDFNIRVCSQVVHEQYQYCQDIQPWLQHRLGVHRYTVTLSQVKSTVIFILIKIC